MENQYFEKPCMSRGGDKSCTGCGQWKSQMMQGMIKRSQTKRSLRKNVSFPNVIDHETFSLLVNLLR